MAWQERVRQEIPRQDIPPFLTDLQALVAALREGRPWERLLTPRLHRHGDLVLEYLDPGPAQDAVRQRLDAKGPAARPEDE